MAKRKVQQPEEETIIDIVEAKDNITDYINKNKGLVFGLIGVLLLLVAGYFIYKNIIVGPRQEAAIEQISKAQDQFARDSFSLALENPGAGYEGFLEIIENYGGTATANTAKYYAGVSYLNLGRFDDAVEYLEDVSAKGEVLPIMKHGTLGDAYSELGQMDKARSAYKKAISNGNNSFLTPYFLNKLALLNLSEGKSDEAQKLFSQIKNDYPESGIASEVDKYLVN